MQLQRLETIRRPIGNLRGVARPTDALRRQMRTLYGGERVCRDIGRVLNDTFDVSFLGGLLSPELAKRSIDVQAIANKLTPKSGVLLCSGLLEHGVDQALRAGSLNPYVVAEHVLKRVRDLGERDYGYDKLDLSLGDTCESDVLLLIFNNTNFANLGDATGVRGSTTAGSLYVGTHTSNPGETGNQTTNESAYTSYARVAVARSSGGWTISGTSPTQAANASSTTFPACTGGSETETHFNISRASSSTGELMWYGALTSSLAVSNGITPSFASGNCVATLD